MIEIKIENASGDVFPVLIDDEDLHFFINRRWSVDSLGYVASRSKKSFDRLHRLVAKATNEHLVDHIDGNKLNNKKSNLRICSNAQNLQNRGANRNNSSGKKGVYFNKKSGKWIAQIGVGNKRIHVGTFSDVNDAAAAYKEASIRLHKDFARAE